MSGVYIGGIEMPKTYPLTVTIYPDGQVLSETVGAKDIHGHATYVPPHGRCIDANALKASLAFAKKTAEWAVPALRAVLMVIDEMPTIIPANDEVKE